MFDLDKWAKTVNDGRRYECLLNGRYEVCVIEAHEPFNWIVGAYDTRAQELVPAALLREVDPPTGERAAVLCALALDERVIAITP